MPREELRSRLGIQPVVFPLVVKALAEEQRVEERDGELAAVSHQVADQMSDGPAARLLELLGAEPFAPPSLAEAMRTAGATPELVRAIAQRGDPERLSDDVAFTRDAYDRAVASGSRLIAAAGSRGRGSSPVRAG